MLIRMSRWMSKPQCDKRSLELWANGVLAIWQRQPGLVQVHLLTRPGSEERMTLSVWRSQDDYERFLVSKDLATIVHSFDEVYEPDGAPQATAWHVLTDDWPTS